MVSLKSYKTSRKTPTNRISPKHSDLPPDTRNRLIQVAKRTFAEKSYDGATVKEIASRAGVNVSLISYHFNGKDGLYRTCIEQLGKARLEAAERILQPPQSIEEFKVRLQMLIEEIFTVHIEEADLVQIVTRECDMGLPFAVDTFRDTFLKIYETLIDFFKSAQAKGILRKDLDFEIAGGLFHGGIFHCAQKDRINQMFYGKTIRDSQYRSNVIRTAMDLFLSGCVSSSETSSGGSNENEG